MTQQDVARMMADMNRLAGMVKTEAETSVGINRSGEKYVSIRRVTAEDLLTQLNAWQTHPATSLPPTVVVADTIGTVNM